MKCEKCGFIYSKDFERCPYCGSIQESPKKDVLAKNVKIGGKINVRVRTLLYLIFANAFVISFLVDLFLGFKFGITLISFLILGLIAVILECKYKKSTLVTVFERVNLYIIVALILGCGLARFNGTSFDLRPVITAVVLPSYIILSTILFAIFLIVGGGKKKFRPIVTEYCIIFNCLLMLILFIFTLVNRFTNKNIFHYLTEFGSLSPTLVYVSFGICALFFVNFNVVLIANVLSQAKYIYGRREEID